MEKSFDYIIQSSYPNYGAAGSIPDKFNPKLLTKAEITICSIVERKVGVYKEIVEGDNNL